MSVCFPFGSSLEGNCCIGRGDGAKCERDNDCLGLMLCQDDRCTGSSGCDQFCSKEYNGKKIDCCVPEGVNLHRCTNDTDCIGARTCDRGVCIGDSGCEPSDASAASPTSKIKIVYDVQCLCLGATNTCAFPDGLPCAKECVYTRQYNAASCLLPTNSII